MGKAALSRCIWNS